MQDKAKEILNARLISGNQTSSLSRDQETLNLPLKSSPSDELMKRGALLFRQKIDQSKREVTASAPATEIGAEEIAIARNRYRARPNNTRNNSDDARSKDTLELLRMNQSEVALDKASSALDDCGKVNSAASKYYEISESSATQITEEIFNIFLHDPALVLLYKSAIESPFIRPRRLQKNLERIIKSYAWQLKKEASGRIEFFTSLTVISEAEFLARAVARKLVGQSTSGPEANDRSGDKEAHEVDKTSLRDLVAIRTFLVKGPAFTALRLQLRSFVLPNTPEVTATDGQATTYTDDDSVPISSPRTTLEPQTSNNRRTLFEEARQMLDGILKDADEAKTSPTISNLLLCALFLATDNFMMYFGILEPALQPGMSRLRWQCVRTSALVTYLPFRKLTEHAVMWRFSL